MKNKTFVPKNIIILGYPGPKGDEGLPGDRGFDGLPGIKGN